ncbi:hypothetical protein AeRB84_006760 [Aphanomyces euteiches]|nr:hypothetical protein AeRB84_006760 [Aphanomyces euteiches]
MGHSGADHENENVHENETYANESGVQQSENENDAPRSRVQTPTAGVKPIEKDQKPPPAATKSYKNNEQEFTTGLAPPIVVPGTPSH